MEYESDRNAKFAKIVSKIFNIDESCVKVWGRDRMLLDDVKRGCDYVKSIGENTIVYNNIVPLKERLSAELGVRIIDGDDLISLCIKHDDLCSYSGLIRYSGR